MKLWDCNAYGAETSELENDVPAVFAVGRDTEGEVSDPLAHYIVRHHDGINAKLWVHIML